MFRFWLLKILLERCDLLFYIGCLNFSRIWLCQLQLVFFSVDIWVLFRDGVIWIWLSVFSGMVRIMQLVLQVLLLVLMVMLFLVWMMFDILDLVLIVLICLMKVFVSIWLLLGRCVVCRLWLLMLWQVWFCWVRQSSDRCDGLLQCEWICWLISRCVVGDRFSLFSQCVVFIWLRVNRVLFEVGLSGLEIDVERLFRVDLKCLRLVVMFGCLSVRLLLLQYRLLIRQLGVWMKFGVGIGFSLKVFRQVLSVGWIFWLLIYLLVVRLECLFICGCVLSIVICQLFFCNLQVVFRFVRFVLMMIVVGCLFLFSVIVLNIFNMRNVVVCSYFNDILDFLGKK